MNRSIPKIKSSFLSCEKDIELILRKLFVEAGPYSDILKTLLIVNTKDCLDNMQDYKEVIDKVSLKDIRRDYFRLEPRLEMKEHEDVKSYILLSFDNFTPNATNEYYRDCTISFDIICNTECWDLGDYRLRPVKIMGYIDGLLNNKKLTGIGVLNFIGANELILNEDWAGYTMMFRAVHGDDDNIAGILS